MKDEGKGTFHKVRGEAKEKSGQVTKYTNWLIGSHAQDGPRSWTDNEEEGRVGSHPIKDGASNGQR
jgi:hypothetical protein